MTLAKLRKQIEKKQKKIVRLECKKDHWLNFDEEKKINRLIEAESKWVKLAEKEYDALVEVMTTPPPVPHTVSHTDEQHLTMGNIIKQ